MCSAISIDFTFHPLWNIIAIHRKFQCDLIKFRSKKNVRERVEERETGKEKNNIHLMEENMKTLLIALFRHQLFMTMNQRKSRLAKQNKIRKASIFNFVSCNNGFYHCSNNFFLHTTHAFYTCMYIMRICIIIGLRILTKFVSRFFYFIFQTNLIDYPRYKINDGVDSAFTKHFFRILFNKKVMNLPE